MTTAPTLSEEEAGVFDQNAGGNAAAAATSAIDTLLERVLNSRGSDLHLVSGRPPMVRIDGDLAPMQGTRTLDGNLIERLIRPMLNLEQLNKFETSMELDTSYTLPGKSRFRLNVFLQQGNWGAVMRVIPVDIVPFEKLGLPASVKHFAYLPRGLMLVTGETGSGKSTTLASIIDVINSERAVHIMTVEDPIEFVHTHKKATINQREVGTDTQSFANALKSVLRQDPDVILVGEMRDLETISMAITAAETGHLVFGTLHTQSAHQSITRIIDVFPPHQQAQIRAQLAGTLAGVVSQQLITRAESTGRLVAAEVMVCNSAIRAQIREDASHQIPNMIQTGAQYGMQTMDQALGGMLADGLITMEQAIEHCTSPEDVQRFARRS